MNLFFVGSLLFRLYTNKRFERTRASSHHHHHHHHRVVVVVVVKRRRRRRNVARSGEARGEAICGRFFYRARSEFYERSHDDIVVVVVVVVVVPSFDDGVQWGEEDDGL